MEFFQNIVLNQAHKKPAILAVWVGLALTVCSGFIACSAAPVKLQCSEIKARIDYGNLTEDQLRFAQQELDECLGRQMAAEKRDSDFVEATEKRFTPESENGSDSIPAGNGRRP